MVIDKQIKVSDLEKYRELGYNIYHIANRSMYNKEGKWIRTINKCMDLLANCTGEVIVAEVFMDIRRVAKVKREGRARNPGKRTVKSVKMVTELKGESNADLVVISKDSPSEELIQELKIEAEKIATS